jgi:biopolymer transport protein ExbD
MSARKKKKPARHEGPQPDMNVTPLVDIVLVLLIIFMVVTPALAQGETIEVPHAVKIDTRPRDFEPIKLIMSANGALLLNRKKLDRANVGSRLRELYKKNPNRQLLLNIDAKVRYVHVREMLALIQDVGFKGVSLKVQPKKPPEG